MLSGWYAASWSAVVMRWLLLLLLTVLKPHCIISAKLCFQLLQASGRRQVALTVTPQPRPHAHTRNPSVL
jgi:hypothetical protein